MSPVDAAPTSLGIEMWRRLEGVTVDPELTEGLGARIADPLWLLCRQWQAGEFRGEDAASPILVSAEVETIPLRGVEVGDTRRSTGPHVPLEALIEAEDPRSGPASWRHRLEAGAELVRRLRHLGRDDVVDALLAEFRPKPAEFDHLDPVGEARLRFLARRTLDGRAVHRAWVAAGRDASKLKVVAGADAVAAVDAWGRLEGAVFQEATASGAWVPDRLEYRAGVWAGDERRTVLLGADGYRGGALDWFDVDVAKVVEADERPGGRRGDSGVGSSSRWSVEVLASPLQYPGQPASRFWEFEDGDVAYGDLQGGPEDLARSVIAAFGAVGGDDWLLVPVTLPVGSVAQVRSVSIIDNFAGRPTRIASTAVLDEQAAQAGTGPAGRPWRLFELTGDPSVAGHGRAPMLYLPPVLDPVQESPPIEAVEFRRDEIANLAWAIERRVESAWGRPVDRDTTVVPPQPPTPGVWDYTFMTTVPASWVPMVPVQLRDDRWPQLVLRRGRIAHPRGADTATDPRSVLLDPTQPFLLQEEQVPHGGVRVTRRWQFARDHDGGVYVWIGRHTSPSSGPMRRTPLEFDRLRDAPDADTGR